MSEIVDSFQGKQGRPPIYPWKEWMSGDIHKLVKDEDFNGNAKSFRVGAHRMAAKEGLKVKTEIDEKGDVIFLEFYKPEE
jgi:hypothetical protein